MAKQDVDLDARSAGGNPRMSAAGYPPVSDEDESLWPAASAAAYPPVQEAHLAHVLAPPS